MEKENIEVKKLSLLAGDASNRKYFQYFHQKNYVIMYDIDEKNLKNFIKVTRILKKFVVVPSIIYDFSEQSILVLENFGPTKYANIITEQNRQKIYKLAVETIFDIQKIKNPDLPEYTLNMFIEESNLFFDWYLNFLKKNEIFLLKEKFNLLFKPYFSCIKNIPQALVHRDYHIDNLFYLSKSKNTRCGLIDYQDAVIGPCTYDLVSLTQDARIDVPKQLEHELINYFLKGNLKIKRKNFMFSYNLLAIQRHMKVLGIFKRLSLRDKKDQYLQHLPRVKKMLYENLKKEKFEKFKFTLSPLLNHVRH